MLQLDCASRQLSWPASCIRCCDMVVLEADVWSFESSLYTHIVSYLLLTHISFGEHYKNGKTTAFTTWFPAYASKAEDGSVPIGGNTLSQLQSQEQAGLLDAIDQLRRESIDAEIGIPQIVVCGDQSSGKSSLLEAIAQVPFPAGSGAVTMCK